MPPLFKVGVKALQEQINKKRLFHIASCYSCIYFHEEDCHNPNVTEFDMIETEDKLYCNFWKNSYWEEDRG